MEFKDETTVMYDDVYSEEKARELEKCIKTE